MNSRTLIKLIENADNAYYATQYDKAIQLYQQVLGLDPKNKHARNQVQKAEFNRPLKSKLEDLPTEALQLYKRCRSFIAIGDLAGARKLLRQAVESAQKAGVDFLDAKDLLRNIQSAFRAEGYKKKANKDLSKRQWLKADGNLGVAIALDPTDHSVQILRADLKSLLKAQKLVQELDSVARDSKDFSKVDKELQEILESTKETYALSSLWQELFETRNQIRKRDSSDDAFQYDIFISYSHRDEGWVRNELLPTLERHGLRVCVDYRDFIAGKAAIINMQEASDASHYTLLIVTPRWIQSEWTLYESVLSRTADPAGLKRRTIPLLLEKCDVPRFISILTWVDFTNKKHQTEAWQNLFRSLYKRN
jgi:tetratricopeptide (TPR) repeat protein